MSETKQKCSYLEFGDTTWEQAFQLMESASTNDHPYIGSMFKND